MAAAIIFFFVYVFSSVVFSSSLGGGAVEDDNCLVTRCKDDGPVIRFPFRLKTQPDHCGYPGFQLSCSGREKETVLEFQYLVNSSLKGTDLLFSVTASIRHIDYASRLILISSIRYDGLGTKRLKNNSSDAPSPFKVVTELGYKYYYFFNCSTTEAHWFYDVWFNSDGFQVYSNPYYDNYVEEEELTSCTKMYTTYSLLPLYRSKYKYFYPEEFGGLSWSGSICGDCEAKGEYCKLENKSNSSSSTSVFVCYPIPIPPPAAGHASTKRIVAGVIPGTFFIGLVLIAFYYIISSNNKRKEDELKIEMFLEDYRALKPSRYTYADIKKITNQFKEKLGQGGYGSVFKGELSNDVHVAVKILNSDSKGTGEDFINEVGTIGLIHHVNVVRLVGFCADGCNRALVYEFLPNNSLDKFLYKGKNQKSNFLGWEKMQQIAVDIAKGIEYLHQGCAQRILHFDIKPHNILLDENFNPKISDFGLAKLCANGQSIVSMTMARGTIGYIAPEVFSRNFGNVSAKSDVYSFGMLLLEMVGGRNNNVVEGESNSEAYFPEWIFHHLEGGGEVAIQIENEVDSNIAKKLTIVGLWCIGWHPIDRPSMKYVIQMLEGEDCPPMPPNPFSSTNSRNSHARPFNSELEVISEYE